MNKSLKLIIPLLFSIFTSHSWALITHFNRLGVSDGLPQPIVRSIYQDEFGTIWFGTRQGLCKYNGFYIEPLLMDKDYSSPLGKTVIEIYGNHNGLLFALINDQLIEYNLKTEKQTLLTDLPVGHFYATKERLVYSSANTIYQYNYESRKTVEIAILPQKCFPVNAIKITNTNKTLVACNDGITRINNDKSIENILSGTVCTAIEEDANDGFWVGTKTNGLLHVKSKKEFVQVLNNRFNSSDIRCIEVDNHNTVWFGTINGLHSYNPTTKETASYTHDEQKPYSISHSSVYAIFEDDNSTIWVGTYFGGISYFNPQRDVFRSFTVDKDDPYSLSHPIIGNMIEDNDGNIWICTEGGGLNQLNRKTGLITVYEQTENGNGISHNNLKAIWCDSKRNKLYIGTHTGGVSVLDLSTKKFRWYKHNTSDNNSLPNDVITNMAAKGDSLFIATQNGLAVIDLNSEKISRYKFSNGLLLGRQNLIHNICIDSKKRLWLLLNVDSLVCYDLKNETYQAFKHDPNNPSSFTKNKVNKIFETNDKKILIVTEGDGIMQFDENNHNFRYFTKENFGLMSNYCYNICETPSGKLVATSNNGITVFDQRIALKSFFTIKKNIPISGIIRENGLFVTKKGEVFLGGLGGLVVFPESKIDFSTNRGNLYFSKLNVNNINISANDSTGILKSSMAYTKNIKLRAYQNNIAVEFAISDYTTGFQNVFEYKIAGLNDNWMPIADNRISLANVPHGAYLLEIRPIQTSPAGASSVLSLEIKILPPFYESPLAFALYALFIIAIALSIFKINQTKTRLKFSIEFERKEKEKTEQLNNSKLEFFTNVSHEFRTPLSLIKGHIDLLTQTNTLKRGEAIHVQKIMKQAVLLQNLTEELLDFHKYESGFGQLSIAPVNIVELIHEIYLAHKTNADTHEIDLSFYHPSDKTILHVDATQIQKVINNLISNAIKFTPKKGFVRVLLDESPTTALVSVQDSGCGIAEDEQSRIFERYYQSEAQNKKGFGLGLALSKHIVELHNGEITLKSQINKGSTFTVKLKKGSEHFAGLEHVNYDNLSINTITIPNESFLDDIKSQLPESKIAPNILIVEDNHDLLEMLVEMLSPLYQVKTASDGEEGWLLCKENLPDLVLTDLLMPQMSGMDLCKCIKSNYETSHIPVVILTAVSSNEKSIESFMFGADEYIKKPFDSKILIARCNSLIYNRILLRQKYLTEKHHNTPILATSEHDLQLLSKINDTIEANITNYSFNIDDIAKKVGLGRSRFYLKLKEIASLTPNEYLLKYKMQKAMDMLNNDINLNISEIAFKVGYKSPRYFAKCFKDHFGISPSSVRHKEGESFERIEEE